MEKKYNVNVVFQQPFFNEDGTEINFLNKSATFAYDEEADARAAYSVFTDKKFIELNTDSGMVAFNLLLIEFIDVEKHAEAASNAEETETVNTETETQVAKKPTRKSKK